MKRPLIMILILALILALCPAALAELPTPPQSEEALPAPGGSDALPVPATPTQAPLAPLPNPGSFLGDPGELAETGYAFGGATWEVWYFAQDSDWGDPVTSWLQACAAAGYSWAPDTVGGQSAFTVTGSNGLRAVLIPNYYERAMLMVQQGVELAGYAVPEAAPQQQLEPGQTRLSFNGYDYGVLVPESVITFSVMSSECISIGYSRLVGTSFDKFLVYVPLTCKTGDTFHIDASHASGGVMVTFEESLGSLSGSMKSSTDYCDATILYRDDSVIWGTIDGQFNGGQQRLTLEFYLPCVVR